VLRAWAAGNSRESPPSGRADARRPEGRPLGRFALVGPPHRGAGAQHGLASLLAGDHREDAPDHRDDDRSALESRRDELRREVDEMAARPRRCAPPRRNGRPPSASSPRSKRASPTSTRGASRLDDLRVASPCPASWDAMVGDDRVRFCGQCQKSVYDIKALTPGGLRSLHGTRRVLAASGGPGVEAVRPLGCLAAPTRTAKFRGSSARTRMPSWGPRWVGSCTPPAFSVG